MVRQEGELLRQFQWLQYIPRAIPRSEVRHDIAKLRGRIEMFDNDFLRERWTGLKFQLPYFAAYLIGIVMAFVNWRRYPKACALVFLACVIKFAAALGYALSGAILLPQLNV